MFQIQLCVACENFFKRYRAYIKENRERFERLVTISTFHPVNSKLSIIVSASLFNYVGDVGGSLLAVYKLAISLPASEKADLHWVADLRVATCRQRAGNESSVRISQEAYCRETDNIIQHRHQTAEKFRHRNRCLLFLSPILQTAFLNLLLLSIVRQRYV